MNDSVNKKLTPSEWYRMRRPEFFSDTEYAREIELPREVLSLELENITAYQKEAEFETLGRKLAERAIVPNLIPQVGPTGGGDGKTDTETYPVSQFISDRWFIPENGWDKDEKWAFAISAKKTWKSKADGDIRKIIGTEREYTRIYFITNQLPSSKKKKDAQDEFKKTYNVDVIILDREWILEKIYTNNLIELVVDTLHLTQIYKNTKTILGKNDSKRIKRLEELENNLNNPNRYFEYDFQLVEDALEAAIISRMLEKPRDEVEGKFDRTLKFCKKVNFEKQWLRLHYQHAWTYLNWYNDYTSFIEEYVAFKKHILKNQDISDVELFYNLYNLLIGLSSVVNLSDYKIDLNNEKSELLNLLSTFENNTEKPTSQLIAKTFSAFIGLTNALYEKANIDQYLKVLSDIFDNCRGLLEYPFESIKEMVEVYGDIININNEYDRLIEKIASISEKRNSELSAGEIFIRRGGQKFQQENYKDSIIFFGKAIYKLSKEESQNGMFLSLTGLGFAYKEIGLIWASNNCFITAAAISLKDWFTSGKINKRAVSSLHQLAINELFNGRIPMLFTWQEMYLIFKRQLNHLETKENNHTDEMFDACLTVRLLNSDLRELTKHTTLPDLFGDYRFLLSKDCMLYILGHIDVILETTSKNIFTNEKDVDDFYQKAVNQLFRNQMIGKTNFISEEKTIFTSKILGCEFSLVVETTIDAIIAAETLLAILEGFLATSLENVFPKTGKIILEIFEKEQEKFIEYCLNNEEIKNFYSVHIRKFSIQKDDLDNFWHSLFEFIAHLLCHNFFINEPENYLNNLFKDEEITQRLALVIQHRNFLFNITGNKPKFLLKEWLDNKNYKEYPLKRQNELKLNIEKVKDEKQFNSNFQPDKVGHDKRKLYTVIDNDLWDKSGWNGFGVIDHPLYGFGFFLSFDNKENGEKIFENWIQRLGNEDKDELIRLSIIKGINKYHPYWYRVNIGINVKKDFLAENEIAYFLSRIHELAPNDSKNLDYGINTYNRIKKFTLFPGYFDKIKGTQVNFEKGIIKKELIIRNAWKIGENDIDAVTIKKDDVPIIPDNIIDAPILKVIERKKQKDQ